MRVSFSIALLCVFSFLGAIRASADVKVVFAEKVNVRGGPSKNSPSLGVAWRGFLVNEIEVVRGWSKVEFVVDDGPLRTGWIKSDLLQDANSTQKSVYEFSSERDEQVFDTDFGPIIVRSIGGGESVIFDGQEVAFGMHNRVLFKAQYGNSFLVEGMSGGAICPSSYFWLIVSDKGARAERFGGCSEIAEIIEGDGWIDAVIPNEYGQVERWRFDGFSVLMHSLDKPESKVVNSMDPTAWVGKTAFNYLSSPTTERYLLSMMSLDELELVTMFSYESVKPFSDEGEWVVAVARFNYLAMANSDGRDKVLVALSKKTNEAFIHLLREGENGSRVTQQWGTLPADLTGTMRMAMTW